MFCWFAEAPVFIVFWGARFLGQVVRKGFCWTKTIDTEYELMIEKHILGYFLIFLVFCFSFFVSFLLLVFWRVLYCFFFACVCFCLFCYLFFEQENPVFPPEKAFLSIFECLPLFLLAFFTFPFHVLSLSLSLVIFFLPSFIYSCSFASLFCCLSFLPSFFVFAS